MSESLPKELIVPPTSEVSEDFRRMLEEIIEQNATILERLDDWDEDDRVEVVEYQKPTIVQIFQAIFSFYGACVLIVVCGALAAIFA